jgi:hypothetical protein
MSWFRKDKEPERYYLLPGQGGRARHRKQLMMLRWSIAVGLVFSAAVGVAIYLINSSTGH